MCCHAKEIKAVVSNCYPSLGTRCHLLVRQSEGVCSVTCWGEEVSVVNISVGVLVGHCDAVYQSLAMHGLKVFT